MSWERLRRALRNLGENTVTEAKAGRLLRRGYYTSKKLQISHKIG